MVLREPHPLRDYQKAAVAEAEKRNIICALPTNSGKTVIAAALIEKVLHTENAEGGESRRILFVVPTRELAYQQERVLLEQIPILKSDDTDDDHVCAQWRLGMLIGASEGDEGPSRSARSYFDRVQVCVVIAKKLEEALVHGYLQMEEVALLVIDEAHHARGKSLYATIFRYFYSTCDERRRPRVLALTASPVEAAANATPMTQQEFDAKLVELEHDLDAAAWARVVDTAHCANAEPIVLRHEPPLDEWHEGSAAYVAMLAAMPCADAGWRVDAMERGLSRLEVDELAGAWARCLERAVEVSEPFGPWALDWCARLLVKDLSHDARRLTWYEAKDEDVEGLESTRHSVGGTEAHAHLLRAAKAKLEELGFKPAREWAMPEAAEGSKLHELLVHLHSHAPRKVLIFVQQRVSGYLLVGALRALLGERPGWSGRIDWVCRPGKVGISPSGRGSSTYAAAELAKAMNAFRAELRVLVSTSILEEGIDVPECDAVIAFDDSTSTRQGQQRKGRARAKNASHAYFVTADDEQAVRQVYQNIRLMNEMTVESIARRSTDRPPPMMPSAEMARKQVEGKCVRTKWPDGRACALLPLERCKPLLDDVYCIQKLCVQKGDPGFEFDLTADKTHFTAKPKGADNFHVVTSADGKGFTCELHLPGILEPYCSAEVADNLPTTLPISEAQKSKAKAIDHAALEGVKYLRSIGVLDEHLKVVGRAEALQKLREDVGAGKRRSSTRANKYAQHVKEAYVRALPALFITPPSTDAAGGLSVWCHPLTMDGASTGLALLLSGKCPVRELLVGPERQRQLCVLEDGFPLTLSEERARLAARWLVGALDLTQAGNAGEPLHASLNVPQQLLLWKHTTGTFSANPIKEVPTVDESAALDAFPRTREWRNNRRTDEKRLETVKRLATSVASIVASIGARLETSSTSEPSSPAVIVTLDLDRTLWKGECLDWPAGSFVRHSETKLFDAAGQRFLELHDEVHLVLAALNEAGVRVAIASASPAADNAHALLKCFGLFEFVDSSAIEMGSDEATRNGNKVVHLQKLSERLGVPLDRLLLFDDAESNVHRVREILGPADSPAGCSAMCVDPAAGLTAEALLLGLEHRLAELKLRAKFTEERAREEGREEGRERLRKMVQSHADTLAKGQANLDDQCRVASKLQSLAVEPGWWLAAPLAPAGSADAGSTDALDWDLMEHAKRLFETCTWPSLAHAETERLVQASALTNEDGSLAPGAVDLCALATYATERHLHHNLLLHVHVDGDGDGLRVSGDVRSRQVHAGATAAKRIVQADGTFRTQETERAVGFKPHNVRLLPLRSSHHEALRVLKRLLWRLEHLVRLTEPDVGALFGATAPLVPLERLSAAMTHPGASAEATARVDGLSPLSRPDRSLHDERGCCQWEELEWLGDAMLRYYAVMHVLVHDQGTSVKGLSPAKQKIECNQELHRRAKLLELPTLALCTPFVTSATLPQLRKQACSIKDQADPMESLLGTVILAAIDAAQGERKLATATHAAFGFFDCAVLPPEQSSSTGQKLSCDTVAKLVKELVTQFERSYKDVENDELAADLRAALDAQAGGAGPMPLDDVVGMLHACCLCRSGTVFERAEFLGDAFLQIAVSLELARRFPDRENGELTEMRSAFVSNVHLGRLLTRRFGKDLTRRFFTADGSSIAKKPDQLKVIEAFMESVPGEPLDVIGAIKAASEAEKDGDKVRARAQVLAATGLKAEDDEVSSESSQWFSKRGIDYRKPIGDQYEAIVGLVFCAYKGDCEATWRFFENDFFPPDFFPPKDPAEGQARGATEEDEQRAELNKALRDSKRTKMMIHIERQRTAAQSAMGAPATQEQSEAEALAEAFGGGGAGPQPMETETVQEPVGAGGGFVLDGDGDLVLEPDEYSDYVPQAHQAPLTTAPLKTASEASAAPIVAGHAAMAAAAAQESAPSALPPAGAANSQEDANPVGAVNERLQKARISRRDSFLRSESSDTAPFRFELYHVESGQLLGRAMGHAKKKAAEKAAYKDMLNHWQQREIQALLEQSGGVLQQPVQPSGGAAQQSGEEAQSTPLVQHLQLAGSKRALTADINGLHAFATGLRRALPSEAEADDDASFEVVLDAVVNALQESNEHFLIKIKKLASVSGLSPVVLQAVAHKALELSRRVRPRPPEAERSAGRLFHDVLLEAAQYDAMELGANDQPTLFIGDTVRIVGLQNATQHNGTTGEVCPGKQDGGKVAVSTKTAPKGIKIKASNLQLLRLGEDSLLRLPLPARQLTYYLQTAEDNEFDRAMLCAHGLELPLFFFHTYAKLRGELDSADVPLSPHIRLEVLRTAVRDSPTLSLCGAYDDRVRRRCDLEEACRDEVSLLDSMQMGPPLTEGGADATFNAMVLPAEPPGAEPQVIKLPLRLDYLNAITESLVSRAGGVGAPLGMFAHYEGQETKQPMLYFLIAKSPAEGIEPVAVAPLRQRNERASSLAGFDIFGDAILADVELEPMERNRPVSQGIPACERFLAMKLVDPLAFVLGSAWRPLLGCWVLPRLAAWSPTRQPKGVMEEFAVRHYAKTACFMTSSSWPVHTDEDGKPMPHTPFEGASYTNVWLLAGREPPPEAEARIAHLLDYGECHELRGSACARKKNAENDAVLALMRALSDATPSPPWVPLGDPLRLDGITAAESAAAAGSTVTCSYTLYLDPNGTGDALAEASAVRLESLPDPIDVVIGAGVLHPMVEELIAEVAGEWQEARDASVAAGPSPDGPPSPAGSTSCNVRIRALYRGLDVWCVLAITVHNVARGEEESEYELAGGAEGLGARRMEKLEQLVQELRPTCLADVGCGEGSLLLRLLEGGAPASLTRLVGIDVSARALRRGSKKLGTARAKQLAASGGAAAAAAAVPSVQMLHCSLAELDASRLTAANSPNAALGVASAVARTPPDVLTLVEVVEHLDPPALDELGPALLGRCAPRALIVTTPNKEYNLNMMVRCSKRTECPRRNAHGIDESKRRTMIARNELCKGCALFSSGQPPLLEHYPKRNRDHRFEFTRREFREWAEQLAAKFGYDVRFDGAGGGPFDEPTDPANPFHGPGPSALVCVFERKATSTPGPTATIDAGLLSSSSSASCVMWDVMTWMLRHSLDVQ